MTGGLRIRDASGNITFDFTERFARIIGQQEIKTVSGFVTVDGTYGGNIWYQYHPVAGTTFSPAFSVSGNTISWVFNTSSPNILPDGLLIYGRY